MTILWIATVAAGVAGGIIYRWISGPEERHDKTTERLVGLADALKDCKIDCATRRGDYVQRVEYEARMLRFENTIVRVHAHARSNSPQNGFAGGGA